MLVVRAKYKGFFLNAVEPIILHCDIPMFEKNDVLFT